MVIHDWAVPGGPCVEPARAAAFSAKTLQSADQRADEDLVRRLVANAWWLVGLVLVGAVLDVALLIHDSDKAHQQSQQRAVQHEVTQALTRSVQDVLSREAALARVVTALPSPSAVPWPVLSNIVTGQSVAYAASFIEPVPDRDRARFERQTGVQIYDTTPSGAVPAAQRPLHLVVVKTSQTTAQRSPVGLDLASSPIRTSVMLESARTGRQLATPPVRFLGPLKGRYGVVVYDPVRSRGGRLLGWVTASYRAGALAKLATSHLGHVRLKIADGTTVLYSDYFHPRGAPAVVTVAGRRWLVWARPAASAGDSSWLVLGLGLLLAMLITLALRLTSTRESYAMRLVAEREAEEVALTRIATLVAERCEPEEVFALVAEQVGELFNPLAAVVSRFEPTHNRGVVVGQWTTGQLDLSASSFALDGGTAGARAFRTGRPARPARARPAARPGPNPGS